MGRPILNLDEVTFVEQKHGRAFDCRLRLIGRRIGTRRLGYRVTGVAPGRRTGGDVAALADGSEEARIFSPFGRHAGEVDYWDGEPDDPAA